MLLWNDLWLRSLCHLSIIYQLSVCLSIISLPLCLSLYRFLIFWEINNRRKISMKTVTFKEQRGREIKGQRLSQTSFNSLQLMLKPYIFMYLQNKINNCKFQKSTQKWKQINQCQYQAHRNNTPRQIISTDFKTVFWLKFSELYPKQKQGRTAKNKKD